VQRQIHAREKGPHDVRVFCPSSGLEEVTDVAISTSVDVCCDSFRHHPKRYGLENSATYAPSGRALALV
jgi:hypothetical protein